MSKENIFDLSKIITPSYDKEKKYVPEVDKDAALKDFNLVPPNEWKNIPYGAFIRYLRKDGSFRKGGVVQNIWTEVNREGTEVIKIDILSSYGNKSWSINNNNIEKIWMKNNTMQTNVLNIVDIKEDIESCKKSIKQLTIQIQKINNEQIRIVKLIKKLHNIK